MSFAFNEYMREQFGGYWNSKDDGHTALFAMAYGNALAAFLTRHGITVKNETCGNNVRLTLPTSAAEQIEGLHALLTDTPFPTLGDLMLHESGLAGLVRR